MDILFVLLGIAVFFAAAAVFAIEHFEINPAQAILSFFVPPFAWWLYSNYWKKTKKIALAQILALLLIIGGVSMMKLMGNDAGRFSQLVNTDKSKVKAAKILNYVGSDASLKDLADANRKSEELNGRVNDLVFSFNEKNDVAEFDKSGVLRIKHGKDFYGDIEIAIAFNEFPPKSNDTWSKTIRPDTPNAPVIYLSWFDKSDKLLKSLKYANGYNLDFTLKYKEFNRFAGYMQLVLPDPENSFLVGNFPVYSSRLRFDEDGLVKTHDSIETLEVIANQTLSYTYGRYVKKVFGFEGTDFNYLNGDGAGSTIVYFQNDKGYLKKIPLTYYKGDNGWFLDVKGLKEDIKNEEHMISSIPSGLSQAIEIDSNNPEDTQPLDKDEDVAQAAPVEAIKPVAEPKVEQKPAQAQLPQSIKINVKAQADEIENLLKPIVNKDVEIESTDGKVVKGVYVGVNRKQLVVESQVAGGEVEYLTSYYKLKSLKVVNSAETRPQSVEFFSPETP